MKTFAQALDLVDDPRKIAEYIEYHANPWPEVVAGLRRIGIRNMRIWRSGARLFMVYEAPDDFDPARDYQSYTNDPRCREWDELMRTYQKPIPGAAAREGEWWSEMELVFEIG